ncbi:unnamed protein product [Amoebophrya sp. A120]|nr:unnamed protein product [Amoebophrya sp. A120]|eukprot:GSA120T00017077001.1
MKRMEALTSWVSADFVAKTAGNEDPSEEEKELRKEMFQKRFNKNFLRAAALATLRPLVAEKLVEEKCFRQQWNNYFHPDVLGGPVPDKGSAHSSDSEGEMLAVDISQKSNILKIVGDAEHKNTMMDTVNDFVTKCVKADKIPDKLEKESPKEKAQRMLGGFADSVQTSAAKAGARARDAGARAVDPVARQAGRARSAAGHGAERARQAGGRVADGAHNARSRARVGERATAFGRWISGKDKLEAAVEDLAQLLGHDAKVDVNWWTTKTHKQYKLMQICFQKHHDQQEMQQQEQSEDVDKFVARKALQVLARYVSHYPKAIKKLKDGKSKPFNQQKGFSASEWLNAKFGGRFNANFLRAAVFIATDAAKIYHDKHHGEGDGESETTDTAVACAAFSGFTYEDGHCKADAPKDNGPKAISTAQPHAPQSPESDHTTAPDPTHSHNDNCLKNLFSLVDGIATAEAKLEKLRHDAKAHDEKAEEQKTRLEGVVEKNLKEVTRELEAATKALVDQVEKSGVLRGEMKNVHKAADEVQVEVAASASSMIEKAEAKSGSGGAAWNVQGSAQEEAVDRDAFFFTDESLLDHVDPEEGTAVPPPESFAERKTSAAAAVATSTWKPFVSGGSAGGEVTWSENAGNDEHDQDDTIDRSEQGPLGCAPEEIVAKAR